MRIIRFLGADEQVHHGLDLGNGAARPLVDPQGVLGRSSSENGSTRALLRGKHVVVADDDSNMRELMTRVLDKMGCQCTTCADGAEAMAAIVREPIDLIVSDIVMPHHNGYEIFTAARERYQELPIVLVTGFGYDPNHSIVRATQEGLASVLYKPFTPQQLLAEIELAIRVATPCPADALKPVGEAIKIERLLAPVAPTNVLCIGRNYPQRGAVVDSEAELLGEEHLEVFMKPTTSIVGPGATIRMPAFGSGVDPVLDGEGELAIVIGAAATAVEESAAGRFILGLTAANDVTARHWQTRTGAPCWMRGKGFDTFCPLGPAIVPYGDALAASPWQIRTIVNGHVVRQGSTADMLHSVPRIVSELSRHLTLEAGTVILTGAAPRIAADRAAALEPGDEIAVDIQGIGRLVNHVEA